MGYPWVLSIKHKGCYPNFRLVIYFTTHSMGAALGNKNAVGGSGGKVGRSGRKSLYKERKDVLWHDHVWQSEQNVEALIEKVKSRRYAGRDMAALKLLQGDKTIIAKFMDKLVPDMPQRVDVTSGGEPLNIVVLGSINRIYGLPTKPNTPPVDGVLDAGLAPGVPDA